MQRALYVLLDFNGRIKRLTWLIFFFALMTAEEGCEVLFRHVFHISGPAGSGEGLFPSVIIVDMAGLLGTLIFLWPALALDVKRWHDMGRSGYYTLIIYGPFLAIYAAQLANAPNVPEPQASRLMSLLALIGLVYFIMLAARKGTAGANRFGPAEGMPSQA
jgi:uncharacterized membrane protein YhaH (DUF805 family)